MMFNTRTVVAAAALILTSTLTAACHQADVHGNPTFPTQVAPDVQDPLNLWLDVYAIDRGQPNEGNTGFCVWSFPLNVDGTIRSHIFEDGRFNAELTRDYNRKLPKPGESPTQAAARAEAVVKSCNPEVMPPGVHLFDIRNLKLGEHLYDGDTIVTDRKVEVYDGGMTDWLDMCIARNPEGCLGDLFPSTTDTEGTGATTEGTGGGSDTGDMCSNDLDCSTHELCQDGTCQPKIEAGHRPAGLSPDPNDDRNKVGNGTDWVGPNHFQFDWRYLTGELQNGKAVEHRNYVKPTIVTLLGDDQPQWDNNDPLCFVDDDTPWELSCPDTELIPDGEHIWGIIQVDSEWFIAPVVIEIYASKEEVAIVIIEEPTLS